MIRRKILGLSLEEATFTARGFAPAEPLRQCRLEDVGRTFLRGYLMALDERRPAELSACLAGIDAESRGFAYEGAAMSLLLQDRLLPWRSAKWQRFLDGPGSAHTYMVHVGAGWAVARLPWLRRNVDRAIANLDPVLRWLVLDGYGFHEGYFHHRDAIDRALTPRRLHGYARRAFDQGLGRSIWFVNGADVDRVSAGLASFPRERRADLWSGVGLACAYAGGATESEAARLYEACAPYAAEFSQGASFAAKCRERAGNPTQHTEMVCRIVCGMSARDAAAVTDAALAEVSGEGYEAWRARIQRVFAGEQHRLKSALRG